MADNDHKGPKRIGEILPPVKPLSRVHKRLLTIPLFEEDEDANIVYQHSVFCQTCMPYRNPGENIRLWERRNGIVRLEIQAGRGLDPDQDAFVDVGLPFGPKPRLALYHLNAEALRTQSRIIELEDSLTAFVSRTLGLDAGGKTIRAVKEQLSRLAAADFRLGAKRNGRAITIKGTVIEGLELWTPRNERQRVLWPTTVAFSPTYFESLMNHAVPLNEAAVARLSHTAMGLDLYTWLAQRLHRIHPRAPALVPWVSLKEQFGLGYGRMDNFKRVFQTTLRQVHAVYPEARFSFDARGMRLSNSRPPVAKRLLPVR
jgi:Plasmid encoded RepA protein